MKTFAAVSRGDAKSELIVAFLKERLNLRYSEKNPDLVVSVGGDGTFLGAFQKFFQKDNNPAFLGVHTGNLGFYSDWKVEELDELISHINNSDNPEIVEYPVLNVKVNSKDQSVKREEFNVINELTITSNKTLVLEVFINGELFEVFRGTGICVSTPSGSTAYNKSLGGAVIHPSVNVLQFSEMASINNNVYRTLGSPMILPSYHELSFKTVDDYTVTASFDNLLKDLSNVHSFETKISETRARFVRYKPHGFWSRVQTAFV